MTSAKSAFPLLLALTLIPLACTDDGGAEEGADEAGSETTSDSDTGTDSEDTGDSGSTTDTGTGESSTDSDTGSDTDTDTGSGTGTDTDTGSDTGTDTGETGSPSCAELEADYDAVLAMNQCELDEDCKIVDGDCSVGIGGCYHAVNVSVDVADLDAIAMLYDELGCTSGVCDCPAPPDTVTCEMGVCTAG